MEKAGFQPLINSLAIVLPVKGLTEWLQRWKVKEFYLFGSVLREDFCQKESDIDVLVKFEPEACWGFEFVTMQKELEELFDRRVDLLTKASIEKSHNWIRRQEILENARLIYVAG